MFSECAPFDSLVQRCRKMQPLWAKGQFTIYCISGIGNKQEIRI
ncbi:MAG: hypothetical protein ACOX0Q_04600 [Syntrophomonadaceae bacterium]